MASQWSLRTIRTAILLSLAVVFMPGNGVRAQDAGSMVIGDWVTESYAQALARTKSPIQSRSTDITAITIARSGHAYDWSVIYGFHETVTTHVIAFPRDASKQLHVQSNRDVTDTFDLDPTGTSLVWRREQRGKAPRSIRFTAARPSLATYARRLTIAGGYFDADRHPYTFTEDGEAIFPTGRFRYEVQLDPGESQADSFCTMLASKACYEFEWQADKLIVYSPAKDDPVGQRGARLAELTRQTGKNQ